MDFHVVLCVHVLNSSSTILIKSQDAGNYAGNVMATLSREEENRVFEVIDRVLKQVFGEEAARFMYQYLEHRYSWSQREFSEKIDAFAKGMEEFLSSGAYMVESKILDTIYPSYDVFRKTENESSFGEHYFASQIRLAKQKA
jgi:hypothetical protein